VGLLSVASRSAKKRYHDDLFNHLVGRGKNLRRQLEAKRFRSFAIDHQFDLRYSHYRQISGVRPLYNAPAVDAGLAISISYVSTPAGLF